MTRARKRGSRQGFTLIELLVVVVIIGILGAISIGNFQAAQDKARVANLQSNLKIVSTALETFSSDQNGHYPLATDINTAAPDLGLLTNKYLPGDKWPKSPWGRLAQSNNLVPSAGSPPMLTAAEFMSVAGQTLPQVNNKAVDIIGPGTPVTSTTFLITTYGAIFYDLDPPNSVYVLYGIGKEHTSALLSAAKSNGGN